MERFHILPINDSKEHQEDINCHCNPSSEYINDSLLIIHNSYDGREKLEKVQRQNLEDLKTLYNDGKLSLKDIGEILNEALQDEEYEVAVSIRDFLNDKEEN